jgi:hypothetical protein
VSRITYTSGEYRGMRSDRRFNAGFTGWRNTLKNGKQLTIIEHPESYEVRRRGASTYFYFDDEPASRNSTGRMTRKQAEQAAKAFVGPEQLKAKGK